MKTKKPLFYLYPESEKASRLSVIGGGIKILSIFLLVAAILYSLAMLVPGMRILFAAGFSTAIWFIVDELEDLIVGVFLLWGAFAICRYAACVLQAKANLLVQSARSSELVQANTNTFTNEPLHAVEQDAAPTNNQGQN